MRANFGVDKTISKNYIFRSRLKASSLIFGSLEFKQTESYFLISSIKLFINEAPKDNLFKKENNVQPLFLHKNKEQHRFLNFIPLFLLSVKFTDENSGEFKPKSPFHHPLLVSSY